MHLRYSLLCALAILSLALPALAGCPLEGVYTSMAGQLDLGRASESWPGGAEGQIDNAVRAVSWDGAQLGLQWELACPATCTEPLLVVDTVDEFGDGLRTYHTEYCGGQFWLLGGTEVWSAGDADYSGGVNQMAFETTIVFEAGVPVLRQTVATLDVAFADCENRCANIEIANAMQLGTGAGQDFPAGYPLPVAAPDCVEDALMLGSWWDIAEITMTITPCSVPTENVSWGQAKASYR